MKSQNLFLLFCIMVFFGCITPGNKNSDGRIQSFIPGTYIRSFAGEYSKGNDTLFINQPNESNNYYLIEHRSSYQKIRDKKILPIEYKSENWIAIFNETDNVLVEQKNGKLISFLEDENALLLGNSRFNKIK